MVLCTNCGKKEAIDPTRTRRKILHEGWCHTCLFWQEIADDIKNGSTAKMITPDYVVYHYKEYVVKPALGQMLGFGGHVWRIVKHDQVLITNNLWLNGDIPDNFKTNPYLQPNCVVEQGVTVEEVEHALNMYHCSNCGSYHDHGTPCDYKPPIFKRTTRSLEELEEPEDDNYPF